VKGPETLTRPRTRIMGTKLTTEILARLSGPHLKRGTCVGGSMLWKMQWDFKNRIHCIPISSTYLVRSRYLENDFSSDALPTVCHPSVVHKNSVLSKSLSCNIVTSIGSLSPARWKSIDSKCVRAAWSFDEAHHAGRAQDHINPLLFGERPQEIAAFQAMLDKAPTASTQAPTATPAPTPVAYQQQAEPAKQSTAQPISADESSEDASRRAKQHAACLELAKENPSITCR
jgi:hypothetical protein